MKSPPTGSQDTSIAIKSTALECGKSARALILEYFNNPINNGKKLKREIYETLEAGDYEAPTI